MPMLRATPMKLSTGDQTDEFPRACFQNHETDIHDARGCYRARSGRESRRTTVVSHVLELARVRIDATELVPVVVQRVDGTHQPVDGGLRLIPDIGRWRDRILELVFVLLKPGLLLLDLLERLRRRLDGCHDVLRQAPAVYDGYAGVCRCDDAASRTAASAVLAAKKRTCFMVAISIR